ncbi:thermonuclease family protein [Hydrogenophaga taeniospiralis]|uniref:thermonuclease family protein n=1 Tax=Hydrogenophaga taeniospiralis TaxID=65656 RepID=UPI001CF9AB2F|nr:thermonuclease family protein [Hydrogenophaga taeniospiralis]UCU92677.1 thermonuclease family protein [Hydrogenophaga taeniospiralis]
MQEVIASALICLVVGVTDGDTLKARCGTPGSYQVVKVRIGAIDAPEKSQAFGTRSRQHLNELCHLVQATIRKTDTDRYGRTVADVECRGQDVATEQVKAGMAWVFDRYSTGYEWLYRHQDAARNDGRGLWTDSEPVAPWEWRASRRKS